MGRRYCSRGCGGLTRMHLAPHAERKELKYMRVERRFYSTRLMDR